MNILVLEILTKSAGHCLPGVTRLRGAVAITYHKSFQYSISNCRSNGICWFAGLQSAVGGSLLYHPGPVTKPWNDHILLFWGAKKDPRNSLKLPSISNTPKNQQTDLPRLPKVSKMRSKRVPEIIKFMKKSKKWHLMKTQLFTILLIGWDIRNQQNFHSKIVKKHACTPHMFVDASNHRIYQKVIQNGLQRGT